MGPGGGLVSFSKTDSKRLSADVLHIVRDQNGDFAVTRLLPELLLSGFTADSFFKS